MIRFNKELYKKILDNDRERRKKKVFEPAIATKTISIEDP